MTAIATLYSKYQIAKRGRFPQNEAEFRQFANEYDRLPQLLDTFDAANLDELFVSERNGEPFVLLFGKDIENSEEGVIGYESGPTSGTRMVGYRMGMARCVAEEHIEDVARSSR